MILIKKKKMLLVTFAASIVAFPLFTSSATQAADSNASITFEAPGEDATAPYILDPNDPSIEDPDQPIDGDEGDGNVTGETGPLTLDFVSHLDFGDQSIESSTQVYESTTEEPFIQVTDRRGTGAGWAVTAQASEFTSDGTPSLTGSIIDLNNGEAISNSNSATPSYVNEEISLTTGSVESQNVVTAEGDNDEGMGSWIVRWFGNEELESSVRLTVPAGSATTGDHTSVITWTLTSDSTGTPDPNE